MTDYPGRADGEGMRLRRRAAEVPRPRRRRRACRTTSARSGTRRSQKVLADPEYKKVYQAREPGRRTSSPTREYPAFVDDFVAKTDGVPEGDRRHQVGAGVERRRRAALRPSAARRPHSMNKDVVSGLVAAGLRRAPTIWATQQIPTARSDERRRRGLPHILAVAAGGAWRRSSSCAACSLARGAAPAAAAGPDEDDEHEAPLPRALGLPADRRRLRRRCCRSSATPSASRC